MSHKKFYVKAGFLWLLHLPAAKQSSFAFGGKRYAYFRHRYNVTWLNERRVEIPVARAVLAEKAGAHVLEVGNVLPCYDTSLTHTVIDKYESSARPGFFQADAETFTDGAPYDLIISISTLEHVGWDETPRDEDKIGRTIRHLRGLLAPGGELVFTAPVGYSPPLDRLVDEGEGFIDRRSLRRVNALNEWEEAEWSAVKGTAFHRPYPFANALVVARISALSIG
ncbi:MAG TPA: class I SAM-dependent methyltransferase [Kiritimatiellia bacterium]|nr:class I SAM-dependent methyltransferase [Kiritimatiellia bacterium]HMO99022.1 class I SAM-dependent methyltransferase [Kiritimatiellia bacterium]HMP95909.1 class I SAM-dependent methyltransferase [Kiritimatiellia bacterium]